MSNVPNLDELRPLALTLIEAQDELSEGTSKPLIAACRDDTGVRRVFVVKLRDPGVADPKPWHRCLARELVGSVLARALGLPVPDYAIVTITDEVVAAHRGSRFHQRLQANIGANFGCELVENALSVAEDFVGDRATWAEIMNFDAILWNIDRQANNLLMRGDSLVLIDHGSIAPTWTFRLPGLPETTAGSMWTDWEVRTHVAYPRLQRRGYPFGLGGRWANDAAAALEMVAGIMPLEWSDADDRSAWKPFLSERGALHQEIASALYERVNA